MCEYCSNAEGKTLLSITKNIASWITYGGGYSSESKTFSVKICNNKLSIANFPVKLYTDDSIKINYCPMCGEKLE